MAGHVAHMGKKRNTCRVLDVRHKEKRLLGRPRHVHENDIKWILKKQESMDWINLTQDWDKLQVTVSRVVNLRFHIVECIPD